MKILHFVTVKHLEDPTVKQFLTAHTELVKQNHCMSLMYSADMTKAIKQAYKDNTKIKLVSLPHTISERNLPRFADWLFVREYIRNGNFDLLHVGVGSLFKALTVMIGSVLPIIVSLPSGYVFTWRSSFWLRSKWVTQIIVPSEDDRDHAMEEGGLNGHKLKIVYGGFFEGNVSKKESPNRAALVGIPNDHFTIGVGGSSHDSNYLEDVITAFNHIGADHCNVYLALAGISRADLRKQKVNLSAEQLRKVRFVDGQSLLRGDYSLYDLFIVINRPTQGISWLLREVISHGVPVVGFDIPENRELIRHMKTGFLVPESNIDELYESISFSIKNPNKIKKMSDDACNFAHKKMSQTARTQRIIEIYRSAVQHKTIEQANTAPSNP